MIIEPEIKNKSSRLKERITHPKRLMARKIMIFISFLLFPITVFYLSPYLSILGPAMGIITGAVIVFASLFIFSLFMGRIFCSYMCPMAGMQEALANIRKRNIKRRSFWVKWLFFIPWFLTLLVLPIVIRPEFIGVNMFFGIDAIIDEIFVQGFSILSLEGIMIYYIAISIIAILGLVVGKRSFCHHLCWVGPFMVIGRKLSNWLHMPSLRLKPDNEKCIDCQRCDRACPMSLDVSRLVQEGNMEDSNCILCGECIDACPKNVIHYKFTSCTKAQVPEVTID
ncbi:MAG: 4Fe-4S binding protein [Candidatus Heimdallarchaeota archaeon]